MLKNRTFIGVVAIIAAIVITFGISPLVNRAFEGKRNIVVLKKDVAQGEEITADCVEVAGRGSYGLPEHVFQNVSDVVGKYATAKLFSHTVVLPDMLSETLDNSDSMLRALGESGKNEVAMSIPIKQYADGLSGKLLTGDIVKIISYDKDSEQSVIYPELQYVEVLTATTDSGTDNISGLSKKENGELDKPVTITLKLQSDLQAMRLSDCIKDGAAGVVFVSRNADNKADFLKKQADVLSEIEKENSDGDGTETAEASGVTKPENEPNVFDKAMENAVSETSGIVANMTETTAVSTAVSVAGGENGHT